MDPVRGRGPERGVTEIMNGKIFTKLNKACTRTVVFASYL